MKYMKGLFTVLLFSFFSASALAQENIVKAYPLGFHVNTGGSGYNTVGYLFKFASYERVFSDKISGQINFGILFNRYKYTTWGWNGYYDVSASYNQFVIEPQVKVYLMDAAPHGLYVGGYYFMAVRSGGATMGVGPNVGYQYFLLDDRLALDANIGVGVGFWVGSGVSGSVGFEMPFQVGAGWAF